MTIIDTNYNSIERNQCTLKLWQNGVVKTLQAAIFLVLISTGSYTQIKWAGTIVDDFLDPLSTESNV